MGVGSQHLGELGTKVGGKLGTKVGGKLGTRIDIQTGVMYVNQIQLHFFIFCQHYSSLITLPCKHFYGSWESTFGGVGNQGWREVGNQGWRKVGNPDWHSDWSDVREPDTIALFYFLSTLLIIDNTSVQTFLWELGVNIWGSWEPRLAGSWEPRLAESWEPGLTFRLEWCTWTRYNCTFLFFVNTTHHW